jgi:hypothetical protein
MLLDSPSTLLVPSALLCQAHVRFLFLYPAGVFFTFIAAATSERCNRLKLLIAPDESAGRPVETPDEMPAGGVTVSNSDAATSNSAASRATVSRGFKLVEVAHIFAPGAAVEPLLQLGRARQVALRSPTTSAAATAQTAAPPTSQVSKPPSPQTVQFSPLVEPDTARAVTPGALDTCEP